MAPPKKQHVQEELPPPELSHSVYVLTWLLKADHSELRIPFMNAQHAAIAKRSLDVDREPNLELVERRTAVEGDVLVV